MARIACTIVNIVFAGIAVESSDTGAGEVINAIGAATTVLAGIGVAVIDINLAVNAIPSINAVTGVASGRAICTGSAIFARIGVATAYLGLTEITGVAYFAIA